MLVCILLYLLSQSHMSCICLSLDCTVLWILVKVSYFGLEFASCTWAVWSMCFLVSMVWISSSFSSNQSWCFCSVWPRISKDEEWTASLNEAQLYSTQPLSTLRAVSLLWRSLASWLAFSSSFSLETSIHFGFFFPWGRHLAATCRFNLDTMGRC